MTLSEIVNTVLDEASSPVALRRALDAFADQCSAVTGIYPDRTFDAWAGDSMLDTGVAINPQAAAHCIVDYTRSAVFLRGIYAAITAQQQRFPDAPLELLYAGCGPFATLVLPLLAKLAPGTLNLTLLDYHASSLESAQHLLVHFGLENHTVDFVEADASCYVHPRDLHLVVAETMQKALEQEPQFAVTANLAPQLCKEGIFIPERIDVSLCLADLPAQRSQLQTTINSEAYDEPAPRYAMGRLFSLSAASAQAYALSRSPDAGGVSTQIALSVVTVPEQAAPARCLPALFTRVCVFGGYCLNDYDAEITLPQPCHDLRQCQPGERYRVAYQLGSYPRFVFAKLAESEILQIP